MWTNFSSCHEQTLQHICCRGRGVELADETCENSRMKMFWSEENWFKVCLSKDKPDSRYKQGDAVRSTHSFDKASVIHLVSESSCEVNRCEKSKWLVFKLYVLNYFILYIIQQEKRIWLPKILEMVSEMCPNLQQFILSPFIADNLI